MLKATAMRKGGVVIKNTDNGQSTLKEKETWGMKICSRHSSLVQTCRHPEGKIPNGVDALVLCKISLKTLHLTLLFFFFWLHRLCSLLHAGFLQLWWKDYFCCGTQALGHSGSVVGVYGFSGSHGMWDLNSSTRDRTWVSHIGRWIPNHQTTKEAPTFAFILFSPSS